MQMVQATVREQAIDQKFVLLEGLFNTRKLTDENEKLTARAMDEFF